MDQQLLNRHRVDISFEAARHQKFCECSGFFGFGSQVSKGPCVGVVCPKP